MLITALKLGIKMPTPMPPKTTVPTLGSRLFFIREVKKWASENGGCRRIIGYQPESPWVCPQMVDLTPIYGHFNREIMMTHHWILDRPRGGFSSWLAARNRKVPNFRRGHTDPKYPTLRFHIQSDRKNETLRFPFGGLNLC